jgi:DNA helicase HerA-like ATPase
MFENANVGGDTMADVLGLIFRYPIDGKPMTIMQLAGFPSEVVDALVSTLCRMAFDLGLWSNGNNPLLLVCEEAHRYMSVDHSVGFGPTRRAISRIAKEGRKHGVFLGLITQRPAELDPTILSQCSTMFAMRMTNDRDQELLRFALPTRLRFKELPAGMVPKSEATVSEDHSDHADENERSLASIIARWRGVATRPKPLARLAEDMRTAVEATAAPTLRRMPSV